MHALNEYAEFLWAQFQYDWSVMSNPWVLYPIIPVLAYIVFFFFKWFVLLAPITIPCSILSRPKEYQAKKHYGHIHGAMWAWKSSGLFTAAREALVSSMATQEQVERYDPSRSAPPPRTKVPKAGDRNF